MFVTKESCKQHEFVSDCWHHTCPSWQALAGLFISESNQSDICPHLGNPGLLSCSRPSWLLPPLAIILSVTSLQVMGSGSAPQGKWACAGNRSLIPQEVPSYTCVPCLRVCQITWRYRGLTLTLAKEKEKERERKRARREKGDREKERGAKRERRREVEGQRYRRKERLSPDELSRNLQIYASSSQTRRGQHPLLLMSSQWLMTR